MRELKFRAFDTENKTWTFVTLGDLICGACTENGDKPLSGARQVWEQYTGLKDKNGKDIYDGDIVEYTTCYFGNEKRRRKVVEWEEWDSDDFGEPHNLGYFDLSEYMEVIGNINENADLLEEEK